MIVLPEVGELSLREKVGQVLCLGWQDEGDTEPPINEQARTIVRELMAGSLVVLKRNVRGPAVTREMFAELQSLARIPLLVSVDQEGGWINRFPPPLHQFPGNMALGAAQEGERLAKQQAIAVAQELRALGVHWNSAPVVDVNNNPDNPVIGLRSFGEDPERVARLGVAAIQGYQETGILACVKHFPGHGDTSVDSHVVLPTVPHNRERMNAVELLPFRAAIAAGIGAIMTSHILFPALDPERPATLSPAILTSLLRNELGFDGLIITDCLEMAAIAGTIGVARGAVEALKAGADVVLICHTLERQQEAFDQIFKAVTSGELSEPRLDEAVGRVLAAKRRFLSGAVSKEATPWEDINYDLLERDIARAALTVVRNNGTLPLTVQNQRAILLTALPKHLLQPYLPLALIIELRPDFLEIDTPDFMERIRNRGGAVLFATAQSGRIHQKAQAQLVRDLLRHCPNLIVVALESPYDLRHFPDVRNYICTYGTHPCSLQALADFLDGQFEAKGRLPITVP